MKLRFQLRSNSAELFADKKICGMVEEDDSVVYDGGEVEDVHFILECEEFEWDRWELLDRVRRIVGSEL